MRKLLIATLALSLVPAVPAQAETSTPNASSPAPRSSSQQQPAREAADDPNRQICVTERLSGSRMPRRVCRTARQWELQDDGSNDR